MNKLRFHQAIIMLFSFLNINASACSLSSEIAASVMKITAIIKQTSSTESLKDYDITQIKMLGTPEKGEYVIESSQGTDCKALGYKATILPSCEVSVQALNQKFSCG